MTRSDGGPDGLLLVDKPEGPTSHDVVRWARKALRTRRVGHAGTLDPFATGLLVLGIGKATRLLRFFSESDKTYEGIIRLGVSTDSGDRTGAPSSEPRSVEGAAARAPEIVATRLTGDLLQVPPMHSAKKLEGVPLHRLARRGEVVERAAVSVRAGDWHLEALDDATLRFRVTCSAGTYVRVLAADLGEMLGCGAHLQSLRRVRSGRLRVEDAVPGQDLSDRAAAALIPLDDVPLPMPDARCGDEGALRSFLHGAATPERAWRLEGGGDLVACRSPEGNLLGIARRADGEIRPDVVLAG